MIKIGGDYARPDRDREGWVAYTASVTDPNLETLAWFSARVGAWAKANGVVLGEGGTQVLPPSDSIEYFILRLEAPVIDGDIGNINNHFITPEEFRSWGVLESSADE